MTPSTLTPITLGAASIACAQAYTKVFAEAPSRDRLCVVLAQSADETARWHAMHNYNAGNMRGHGTAGVVSIEGASEVIDGHEWFFRKGVWQSKTGEFAPADVAAHLGNNGFAAFRDAVEGFEALIRQLGTASHPPIPNRFAKAWDAADRGDVATYCRVLKWPPDGVDRPGHNTPGYFTADVDLYTRGVTAQFNWVRDQLFTEQRQA